MYQSALALHTSKVRRWGYRLAMLAVATGLLLLPFTGGWLWLAILPALASCYWLAQQAVKPLCWTLLSLDHQGYFRVLPSMQQGTLLPQSLICQFGIWLHWQDEQGKSQHCWLYADNFSQSDFRALARHCQNVKWQHSTRR